jgi:hypothetical protein
LPEAHDGAGTNSEPIDAESVKRLNDLIGLDAWYGTPPIKHEEGESR